MPPGCPQKKAKNTSGLRHQQGSEVLLHHSDALAEGVGSPDLERQLGPKDLELGLNLAVAFDSTHTDWQRADAESAEETESEERSEWEDWNDEKLGKRLAMIVQDNDQDKDWIPSRWRKKNKGKKGNRSYH